MRAPDEFHTLNLLSSSSNRPLITLWTTSWRSSCATVSPILKELIEHDGIGEKEGGLGFVEIQMDSVLIGDLGITYMVRSSRLANMVKINCTQINDIPTLLAFSRGEPQLETKVTKLANLEDKQFLIKWLETEARRRGEGGAGGRSWFSSLFGS